MKQTYLEALQLVLQTIEQADVTSSEYSYYFRGKLYRNTIYLLNINDRTSPGLYFVINQMKNNKIISYENFIKLSNDIASAMTDMFTTENYGSTSEYLFPLDQNTKVNRANFIKRLIIENT